MTPDPTVTLFRESAKAWAGGATVHVLSGRNGFMLVPPSPCNNPLAEVLAETARVDRGALMARDSVELIHRGYCRDCLGAIEA